MTTALATMTAERLLAFEERVATAFIDRKILSPIHLSKGNEEQLINIFHDVKDEDWLFVSWRSHFHCLLKGVPEEELYQEIVNGRSMFLNFPAHRIVASAIVGGVLPIALGVALAHKRLGSKERVWVFVGDMTARTGVFDEFMDYARGHELNISIIVEDNGVSTNTPTEEVWGTGHRGVHQQYYQYKRGYPHTGVDQWVNFG